MKTRAALALALVAGTAAIANAQETIQLTYRWQEVNAGTTVPSTQPLAGNSVVDQGEGARIFVSLNILRNGTNAVGQTTTFTPPPAPGSGIIAGLGSVLYRLDGTGADATGTWVNRSFASFVSAASGWAGTSTGSVIGGGAGIDNWGTGQFPAPGATANGLNPLTDFYRGAWTPTSYTARTVNFKAGAGSAAPTNQQNAALINYGIAQPDPTDPTTWYEQYVSKFFGSDFGNGINIPVAPAPSSVALLGLGALVAGRRRR